MLIRKLLVLGLVLVVVSCGPAAPAVELPTTQPPAATATPAPPTPTPGPAFEVYSNNPVVQTRKAPFWDRLYIDPGAIVFHDGQLHMFFNGIEEWPRPVGVGYATSTDGITWAKQGNEPVLKASSSTANMFATSALVEQDGTWVLYFYTLSGSSFMGRQSIVRATAPAPTGPWTLDPTPMLEPGPTGAWDSLQVGSPNVIRTTDGYIMYYDGLLGKESQIGMATSPDGIHWAKYNDPATTAAPYAESDPILRGQPGAWDAARVIDPNVIQVGNSWVMVYESTPGAVKYGSAPYQLGYATSADGIHWTAFSGNPVVSSKQYSDWKGIFLVTLVTLGDKALLYFDVAGAHGNNGTSIFMATHTGPFARGP